MKLGVVLLALFGVIHGSWFDENYNNLWSHIESARDRYEPQMKEMAGNVQRSFDHQFGELGQQIEEIGDYWGDHLETVGNQMESRFKKFGGDMEQQVSSMRSQIGDLGNRMGNVFQHQVGNIDQHFNNMNQHFTHMNERVNSHIENFGSNFDSLGSSLMSQFDRSFSQSFPDVFGMSIFGQRRTPWWQKENVCVKREVLEENDEESRNVDIQVSGNAHFHMQVNQCVEKSDAYECVKTIADDGNVKTLKLTHTCCHGFKNVDGDGCVSFDIKPLEETIAELEAVEFLDKVVEAGLDYMMENVTIFVPNDDAIRDMNFEIDELFMGNEIENVVYNIDDGLLQRRKRNAPEDAAANILKGHFVKGFKNLHDLVESELVESLNDANDKIRVTIYPTKPAPTVMANCAKVVSKNNHATNGMVHVVDKVIVPAEDTIFDVLSADMYFKTFMNALEANGLSKMLSKPGHFTVFAPTDEAFEKLDEATRERILGNGGCSGDLIRSHILSEVVCSGIVDIPVRVRNIAGHEMMLTRDEDGNVEVDGVKLFMKDKMTQNGVIHIIEDVVIQPTVKSVIDHLKDKNSNKLLELLEKTGLTDTFQNFKNLTFFAPSEKAISEIPKVVMDELVKDKKNLADILLHHVATPSHGSCHFEDNKHLDTMGGRSLRLNLHKHFGHRQALGMVQCARIIESDSKVCGGNVHIIDRVLTPPEGDLMTKLETDHPKFAALVKRAKMETDISEGLMTVLAPVDEAFDKLETEIADNDAEDIVRNHLIETPLCCASVLRSSGFLHERRVRSNLGDALSFHRSNGGHIFANQAAILKCDQAATNGVVHSVDSVILPRNINLQKKKKRFIFF